jgi:hypothetical protein
MLGDTFGWERMMRIDVLKRIFNLTESEINNFSLAMEKMKTQTHAATDLQTVFNQQTADLVKSFSQLYNSFEALIKSALVPTVRFLGVITSGLAGVGKFVSSIEWLGHLLGVALPVAIVAAAISLRRLIQQMWDLTKATYAYNRAKLIEYRNELVRLGHLKETSATGATAALSRAGILGSILAVLVSLYSDLDDLFGGAGWLGTTLGAIKNALTAKSTTYATVGAPGLKSAAEQVADFQRYVLTGTHSVQDIADKAADLIASTKEVVLGTEGIVHQQKAIEGMHFQFAEILRELPKYRALAGTTWDSGAATQQEIINMSAAIVKALKDTVPEIKDIVEKRAEKIKADKEAEEARNRLQETRGFRGGN